MTDLRKAAEMALNAWEKPYGERAQAVEDAIEALRQALAQPEQEPVAWVDAKPDGYDFHGLREVPFGKHHLYTAPLIQQEMLKQAYLDGVNSGIKAMQTRSEK